MKKKVNMNQDFEEDEKKKKLREQEMSMSSAVTRDPFTNPTEVPAQEQVDPLEQKKAEVNAGLDALHANKEEAQVVIDQIDDPAVKERLKNAVNDPKALEKEKKRNSENKDGTDTDVKSSFMDTIAYFIPTIFGGLIGGALEGTEGAIGGMESGQKIGEGYRNFLDDKEDRAIAAQDREAKIAEGKQPSAPNYVPSSQWETMDGRPVAFETKTNKWYMGDEEIDPRNIRNAVTKRNVYTQSNINERQQKSIFEKQTDREEAVIKTFMTKDTVKKLQAARDATKPILDLLIEGAPLTQDFIAPFLAKGVRGEVGNLSEMDLRTARVPMAFYEKWKSDANGVLTGNMSDEERGHLINLLTALYNKHEKMLASKAEGFSTDKRAKRLRIDKDDLKDQLGSELGVKVKTNKSKMTPEREALLKRLNAIKARRNKQ